MAGDIPDLFPPDDGTGNHNAHALHQVPQRMDYCSPHVDVILDMAMTFMAAMTVVPTRLCIAAAFLLVLHQKVRYIGDMRMIRQNTLCMHPLYEHT